MIKTVEDIKTAITSLPKHEYTILRNWFSKKDWELWDKKIEDDSKEGRLDFLVEEALKSKKTGNLQEL